MKASQDPAITRLIQNKLIIKKRIDAIKAHVFPICILREVVESCGSVPRLSKPLNHFFFSVQGFLKNFIKKRDCEHFLIGNNTQKAPRWVGQLCNRLGTESHRQEYQAACPLTTPSPPHNNPHSSPFFTFRCYYCSIIAFPSLQQTKFFEVEKMEHFFIVSRQVFCNKLGCCHCTANTLNGKTGHKSQQW